VLFAINYSPQAATLCAGGAIAPDRFKCPPWPDLIADASQHGPVYIHFDLRADALTNRTLDFEAIARMCDATGTPYVNLHLSPDREHFPGVPHDTTAAHHVAAITDAMLEGVWPVVERFGADRVILENLPYYGGLHNGLRPAAEPRVVRRIVEETGCGFLLDISHGRLAARHMGMDERDYLAQLPGEHLRELHVTGIGQDRTGHVCDHLGLADDDWVFVDWVLERIQAGIWAQPWIMAFEYGGISPLFDWRSDPAVIAAQVPRLAALAHGLS